MLLNEASTKQQIENGLSGMRPGHLMMAVSKSLGQSSSKFLGKHLLKIIINAVKSGAIKTAELGAAVKDFNKKNAKDTSNIDWEHVEIDPSTMTFKCVFEGDAKKKIDAFMKEYEVGLKGIKDEIEEQDKKLHDDVKKAKIDMSEDEVDEHGIEVASVIDDKSSKGKTPKELKKDIDAKIKVDEDLKTVFKDAEKVKKSAANVRVDKKLASLSDEELRKKNEEADKRLSKKSNEAKANDKLRAKIKRAIQKGVADEFKDSVKTMFVSTDKLKKLVSEKFKSGLSIEKMEEPRAVCISTTCSKSNFKNVLKEEDDGGKVIDITNGSKDKSLQKIVDYIKDKVTNVVGKDNLGDFYAYRKQSKSGSDLVYVFAGVKDSKLNESLMNEDDLDIGDDFVDSNSLKGIMSGIKISGNKISGFSDGMIMSALMKELNVGNTKEFLDSIGHEGESAKNTTKAVGLILKKFLIDNENDGTKKAIENMFQSVGDNEYKKLMYSELISKMVPDAKDKLAEKGITTIGNLQGLFSNKEVDDWIDSISSQETIKKAAHELKDAVKDSANDIKDKAVDAASDATSTIDSYEYNGPARVDMMELRDKLGINHNKFFGILGASISDRHAMDTKLELDLEEFLSRYEKDPDKAVKMLLAGSKGAKADLIAELACKLKPDAAEAFEKAGYDIDGKINGLASKVVDSVANGAGIEDSDVTKAIAKNAIDNNGRVFDYMLMDKQIDQLDDMFDDGEIDHQELAKLKSVGNRLNQYLEWANANEGASDPDVKAKVAGIKNIARKYNELIDDNKSLLHDQAAYASDARTGATDATRAASKQMQDNEEMKKTTGGWKKALGLDKMFTALGIARLAAKTTGVILNNGKSVVDALGAYAMKSKEDKNVIAQMNFILQNGEDSKSKFDDTKFSVRYDAGDNKWHATCLDNRKMQFPEQEVIDKALNSKEGKKFKDFCLKRWKSIFQPNDSRRAIIAYVLSNFDMLGIDASKETKEFASTMKKVYENFSKIEQNFR